MASVYWDPAVGGDGTTLNDTDMANYGHVERFIPALSQMITVAQAAVTQATAAASSASAASASAASALGAPGTNATSTTSLTVGTGSKSLTLAQTGKAYAIGQVVVIASTASPGNQMTGIITAFNSGTGAMTVDVQQTLGSGTIASWTISLGALISSTLPSQTGNNGKVLTTNGTWASWASALIPSNNLSDVSNAATALSNLGGQTSNAKLTAFSGLTGAANKLAYFTGASTMAVADLTAFARTLLDDVDQAAMRGTLGLTPGTNVQAYDAKLAALAGLTGAADKGIRFTGASSMATFDLAPFALTFLDDANAGAVRNTLGAAASGANTDITSLGGLTTPLSVAQGGTGGATDSAARTGLGINTLAAKYYAAAVVTGATGAVVAGDGITTVTRTGTGVYVVALDVAAPNTNYLVIVTCGNSSTLNVYSLCCAYYNKGTGSFGLRFQNGNATQGSGAADPDQFSVQVIGM